MVTPQAKRAAVQVLRKEHGLSERRACRLVDLGRSSHRYTPAPERDAGLKQRLRELVERWTRAPQSLTGKAVAYLDAQWPKLVRVFEYGFVPLDTNLVENAVRPFAVGRKTWLFGETVGGAEASANLYSVVETARANGLEPWAYLQHVFAELPKAGSFDDVDALLPARVRLRNDGVH